MRIRNKPWAKAELATSKFYVQNPEEYKGRWKEFFNNHDNPIYLELGCGKGYFVKKAAIQNHEINYIAIDLVDAILGIAKRNIEEEFQKNEVKNIALTRYDIEEINNILDKKDNVERIYINFCNPWPKPRHKKRRLTHIRQLEKYKEFLKTEGEIYFKTDDDNLYKATIRYLEETGFQIIKQTENLHKEPIWVNNIETEHEKMFEEQGITTKAIIARII